MDFIFFLISMYFLAGLICSSLIDKFNHEPISIPTFFKLILLYPFFLVAMLHDFLLPQVRNTKTAMLFKIPANAYQFLLDNRRKLKIKVKCNNYYENDYPLLCDVEISSTSLKALKKASDFVYTRFIYEPYATISFFEINSNDFRFFCKSEGELDIQLCHYNKHKDRACHDLSYRTKKPLEFFKLGKSYVETKKISMTLRKLTVSETLFLFEKKSDFNIRILDFAESYQSGLLFIDVDIEAENAESLYKLGRIMQENTYLEFFEDDEYFYGFLAKRVVCESPLDIPIVDEVLSERDMVCGEDDGKFLNLSDLCNLIKNRAQN